MSKFAGMTIDDDHLSKAVTALKSIKTPESNAHGGCVQQDGVLDIKSGVCHGYMARLANPSIVFSKWTPKKDGPGVRLYFEWITGPNSPWKDAFPPEELMIDGEDISSKQFMWDHGFILWHIEKLPSNVQHQFLIATRVARQHPYYIDTWQKLVLEHGYDPAMAYVWMTMWYGEGKPHMSNGDGENFGHSWMGPKVFQVKPSLCNSSEFNFDSATSGVESVKNFLLGRMDEKVINPPYKTRIMYTPVNKLWGNNGLSPHGNGDGYPAVLRRMYSKDFGKITEVYTTFNGVQHVWKLTKEDCIRIGLLEQERLFKEVGIENVRKVA